MCIPEEAMPTLVFALIMLITFFLTVVGISVVTLVKLLAEQ